MDNVNINSNGKESKDMARYELVLETTPTKGRSKFLVKTQENVSQNREIAIEKIIEEGYKIGGEGVAVRNGRVFGSGVYTAVDPNVSIPYSNGGSMMLLSSALVGEPGKDYSNGASADVLVLKKAEYLLPKYIVHFTKK